MISTDYQLDFPQTSSLHKRLFNDATPRSFGRKKQKLAKERAGLSKLPDLKDAEAVQKFFLEEIQLGEELLAQGEYEKGVDHLTNAIAECGQPQQLLQVFQQTLPLPVFQML
ncbi:mitochondrial import receptor subunit TOM20 homolog [Castor canadensis]|uniref:Mitochondrial import receptor subunit TOM20 homolog n=1 Tax=Castor canadensis TaxID=51338 RepID=A0AC58LK12_CASCN